MLVTPHKGEWTDPWVVYHEGAFWLYFVEQEDCVGAGAGLSRSTDGVHWVDQGRVLSRSDAARSLGAGAVWLAPTYERDGRFFMGFTEQSASTQAEVEPAIQMAESTDLVAWRRMGPQYEFRPDPRWYRAAGQHARWHDLCTLARGGGGQFGYWTADPIVGEPGFGFGVSADCCHWRAMPPPRIAWGARPTPSALRMGGVVRVGGRYLALVEAPQAGRSGSCVYVLESPSADGPFAPAPRNAKILTSTVRGDELRLRPVALHDEILLSHVAATHHGERWLAPLKRLVVLDDGTACLAYWPGNDALLGTSAPVTGAVHEAPEARITMLDERLDTRTGVMLEGRWEGLPTKVGDAFVGAGLYIETTDGRGEGILVPMLGQALAGPMRRFSLELRLEDAVDRALPPDRSARFRLLLRGELAELYVNDILMLSRSLPAPANGVIGVLTAGRTQLVDVRAARFTL